MAKSVATLQEVSQTSRSLIDLAREASKLSQLILESGGELTPEIEAQLDVNSDLLLQKVDNYQYIKEDLDAQAALWKQRKDACKALEDRFKKQAERLWERIKFVMKETNTTEIRGNFYGFKLQNTAPALVIEDETKIPSVFKIVVQTTALDKEKIKDALKGGFDVPGAKLVVNGTIKPFESSRK